MRCPVSGNVDIKLIKSLKEKKFRDLNGLFTVEGEKMMREAQESGFEIVRLIHRDEIGEDAMKKISLMSSPSPVLAVIRKPEDKPIVVGDGLFIALDSVRDPGNMGTILRMADWFGVKAVFASQDSVEFYNPKVVQASMGAIFRVRAQYADIPALCRQFRAAGRPVYGTFLNGENIYGSPLSENGLIVMGNESNGISAETAAEVSARILIPKAEGSRAESLNVAIATAITLSEFARRK